MRRKIPSTTALVSFEAAARHESFTKAAQELSITQGAICRQIASLRGVFKCRAVSTLAAWGQADRSGPVYSRRVATQLDAVERDTLSVMGQQGANVIELAVVPTFGTQWLIPRLKDFQRQHPEVTVNLTNRTRPFLFADTEFDAAIYFGDADWSGTESHRLMGETRSRCAARAYSAAAHTSAPRKSQNCRCCSRPRGPMPGASGSTRNN